MIKDHFKKILIATAVLATVGGGYYYYDQNTAAEASAEKTPPKMVSHPTKAAVGSGLIDIEGGIGNISANKSGVIKEVFVVEGDWVEVGQLLASQDDEAERIALQEKLSNLENQKTRLELYQRRITTATRELARIKPLYEIGAVTSSEYDKANDSLIDSSINKKLQEAGILSSQNNIKKAQFDLEQRNIRAPLTGRIVTVTATPGVGASTTNITNLFTIIPDVPFIIKAKVNGSLLSNLFVGQKATITTAYDKKTTYDATVTRISKYFPIQKQTNEWRGSATQMVDVTLSLEDKSLLIGQKVQVQFLKKDAPNDEKPKDDASREADSNASETSAVKVAAK